MGMSSAAPVLWTPIANAAMSVLTFMLTALVVLVGAGMLCLAMGWNFPIARNLAKIRIGRRTRTIGIASLGVICGLAFLGHFGPYLFTDFNDAWLGVLLGALAVNGGIAYLTIAQRWRVRRIITSATAVTVLGVLAIGAVGGWA